LFFVVDDETRSSYCPGTFQRIWRVLQAAGFSVERYGRPVSGPEAWNRGYAENQRVYEVWLVIETQNGETIEIR
jgi:hypothetical protein